MHRWCVLLALLGCDRPSEVVVSPPHWLSPPVPSAFPLGIPHGWIGRSVAPQLVARRTIAAPPETPLVLATPWQVPGDGPARAVLSGIDRGTPAIDLVEIDRAHVAWRTTSCTAPVVGVTADAIICGDAKGTAALGLDGKRLWTATTPFIAMADARVIMAMPAAGVVLRDAKTGTETSTTLPAGIAAETIVAACDRDVFAAARDGKLVRIAPGPKAVWTAPLGGTLVAIDACEGATLVATIATTTGTSLVAIARDTGKPVGRVDGVRGYWPARADPSRLEVATASGVARWSRDFVTSQPLELPAFGELLAKRGDRRLVRATPLTAALIDHSGVRAYVPLGERGAAIGDDMIVASTWLGASGRSARLFAIPRPWQRPLRLVASHVAVAVPAELRDLPQRVPLDVSRAIALPAAAKHTVTGVVLDPVEPALYATTLETRDGPAGLARFELRARVWSWHREDACGAGAPIGTAVTRDVVACAARGKTGATVRATDRAGKPAWEWRGPSLDGITAAGDVVLVRDADRLIVLDAHDGRVLGALASDDGEPVRAVALDIAGMTLVVVAQQGRIVARLPRVAMVPAWSVAVSGSVRELAASGDGVLVALEDGDAFRIDARTADAVALPGLDLVWRAAGDLVTGEAVGGPAPPLHMAVPIRKPEIYHPVDLALAPAIATPWPAHPPLPDSWQYTLYDLTGGMRARNDYALDKPITPAGVRGGGACPLVVAAGPGQRDLLVVEPERGDPVARITLPPELETAPPNVTFSTVVDGRAVAGTILAAPLRVVVF